MYLVRGEFGLGRRRRRREEHIVVAWGLVFTPASARAAIAHSHAQAAHAHGGRNQRQAVRLWLVAQGTEEALGHGQHLSPLGRVAQTAPALDIAELLGLLAVIAPVLSAGEVVAGIQVLQHELMVGEPLAAAQQGTLPPLFGSHLGAGIALDGCPYDEPVQGTLVARSVA